LALNRDIHEWKPEDPTFWEQQGKRVATRNLWISIPCLLVAFGFWQMWGMITVQMANLGFPFTETELFTLVAIAGLAGATLRIPGSFLIRIAGGRNTIACTTALMILPCIGAYFALQHKETPLWVFQFLALLSGVGGGNFACSMSNISSFFPKRQQGLALGLNAGLGNLGVTGMQILIPLVMTAAVFGVLSGAPLELERASGTLLGRIPEGTETWIQNPALFGTIVLVILTLAAWFGMNNLRTITPNPGHPVVAMAKVIGLYNIGFLASAIGLWLFLPRPVGLGVLNMWLALPLIIFLTLGMMRMLPGTVGEGVKAQFSIFSNRHTWSMTVLYIATFGSFIGFSAALPLSIEVLFGNMMVDGERVTNPEAPSALTFAWIGPFIGALIRPFGGWLSDRIGGSIVTQAISAVMVIASVAVGYVMMLAYNSSSPNDYFFVFITLFVVIFAASGIGNGSTFRSIGVIFDAASKGPVLGWTSAVAAYGAFIAPRVMGEQIGAGNPQYAMYGFAAFYALCLVVNWWFYLRRSGEIYNP
jgi:MFS transporter, NNP family, nitrate/nitrite transporter